MAYAELVESKINAIAAIVKNLFTMSLIMPIFIVQDFFLLCYYEKCFTMGRHPSIILSTSDRITFLSIDAHTVFLPSAKEMV